MFVAGGEGRAPFADIAKRCGIQRQHQLQPKTDDLRLQAPQENEMVRHPSQIA
jgi:hypothetical protein